MHSAEKAIILVNVGTPDSPDIKSVRRYLREFLGDKRVINLPWLLRKILVNLIIVPFRAQRSAKLYRSLWSENGSPLLYYGERVRDKLQDLSGDNCKVFLAMRYGTPGIESVAGRVKAGSFRKITILPLFPQYASSTTGSAIVKLMEQFKKEEVIPEIKYISQFYDHPRFIRLWSEKLKSSNHTGYDHIIFSYHGLPLKQIIKIHPKVNPADCNCNKELPDHGRHCYIATCYHTTKLIARELELSDESYSVGFQSRFSDNWTKPFTDELIKQKAAEGLKRILIVAPAFVADCLETIVELGIEYKELFLKHGGEQLEYPGSLNDMDEWIEVLHELTR